MTDESRLRHRGAPIGNTNALKHGFYSRHFTRGELHSLQHCQNLLQGEIECLRVMARRLFAAASLEATSLDDLCKVTRELGVSFNRIANLMQAAQGLEEGSSHITAALSQAIRETLEEQRKG